jgi:sedoheptulokinase
MYVAGIDIGTTSVCGVIVDAGTGLTRKTVEKENDAAIPSLRSWERLQDPGRILTIVNELLDGLAEEWPLTAAVGISCQMHGILYVNMDGDAVSPLFTWQDRRGDLPYDGDPSISYAAQIEKETGIPAAAGYGMVSHYYNMRNGLVPADAAFLCTIGDYAVMKLCGLKAPVADASNAAALGLFDGAGRMFDRSALAALGIAEYILPQLADGLCIAGKTPDGKPVACAIGDNQASFIGAVPSLDRTLLVNIGTGAQVSVYAAAPDAALPLEARPFPGGGYLLVGASLGGGKSYALLERFFRDTCRIFGLDGNEADRDHIYRVMNRLAQEEPEPGTEPLTVSAQFFGTRRNPALKGTITGIDTGNLTPAALVQGMMNGIVDELLAFAASVPESIRSGLACAAVSGNGIRKNPAMLRLLERRLALPLYVSAAREEAALGAAVYAAAASGLFDGVEDALSRMRQLSAL